MFDGIEGLHLSCNLAGRVLDLPATFRPTKKRCTAPWNGPSDARVVTVAFTLRARDGLRDSERQLLVELGLRI